MTGLGVLLAVEGGLLLAAVFFYVLAWRACRTALATLAEARGILESVDVLHAKNLDTIARVEEWTA